MKVLYIVSSLSRSGPILVLQNIVRNLKIDRRDIFIVKLLPDNPHRSITSEFISDGINVIEHNFSKLKLELRAGQCAKIVSKIIGQIRPAVIHAHGYQAALIASKINKSIPKTITLHNIPTEDFVYSKGLFLGKYMLWRFSRTLTHFTRAVAISETVKNTHKNLTHSRVPIDVIYNGINLPSKDMRNINSLKEEYQLSQYEKVFVVIGHLSAIKDPLCVINAFKKAFIGNNNVKLFFLGSGPLKDECIKAINGDQRIFLVGYTENVTDFLSIANYTISASHSEGFGLNVIESLAMGIPTIMSDIDVFNEFRSIYPVLEPIKFKCGDDTSLEKVLLNISEFDDINMSAVQKDVNVRFSAKEMGIKYLNHYKLMISLK